MTRLQTAHRECGEFGPMMDKTRIPLDLHNFNNMLYESKFSDNERELVALTIRRMFDRHQIYDDNTLHSLVEIVISLAGPHATAVTLKATAIQQMKNILLLNDYCSENYNLYMERAWGSWHTFSFEQTAADYITACEELSDDFHVSSWAHFIFYSQDIWHNDDMEQLSEI